MTPTCPKCGQIHTACDKHRQSDGQPCGAPPIQGTTTCRKHAGKKTSLVRQEVAARLAVQELDLDREANPLDELLTEVQRAAAAVRWLGDKVNSLDDDAITWGLMKQTKDKDGKSTTHGAGVNLWVKLWQEERDRLARVCKLALDAGVDERRVRLAESQGAMIVDIIRATLVDLQIEQTERVHEVVSRHLRAISA